MGIEEIYQTADSIFDQGKYEDVIKILAECPADKYTRPMTNLLIASYNNTNQYDEALACLEKHKDLYQDMMRLWYYYAVFALIGKKDCVRAFENIEAGIKVCDEDKYAGILSEQEFKSELADFTRLLTRCRRVQDEMDKNLDYVRELDKVKSAYEIVRADHEIRFKYNRQIKCETIAWSDEKQCWVIAFKRYIVDSTYVVEYVFFDAEFNITEVYRESEGVNPRFLISPSGEIWVTLSATKAGYPSSSEVILPLFNRSRIKEPVIKRDTGMDYFFMNGQTYGYIVDLWGKGKETKLVRNVYDESGLFKDRKSKALKDIHGGVITSIGKKAYLSHQEKLYEISDKLVLAEAGSYDTEKDVQSFVIDRDDEVTTYIRLDENQKDIFIVKYSKNGTELSKELVYSSDVCVKSMSLQSLQDGSQKVQFVAAGVNVLGYRAGEYFIYEGELGDNIAMIKYGTLILQRSYVNPEDRCLSIFEISGKED